MLVIRLTRFGKKKKPFYRIVVAESRDPVKGKYIEKVGHYNPLLDPPDVFVDKEKTEKWLKQGAKPSDTVWNLLVKVGILKKKLVTQRKKTKKQKKEVEVPTESRDSDQSVGKKPKAEKAETTVAKPEEISEAKEDIPQEKPSSKGRSASQE